MNIIEKAVEKLLGDKKSVTDASKPEGKSEQDVAQSVAPAAESVPDHIDVSVLATEQTPEIVQEPIQASVPPAMQEPLSAPPPVTEARAPLPDDDDEGLTNDHVISISGLAREGILTPDAERSRTAEEYRMIKRPLLTRAFSGVGATVAHRNLIMCTSSVEGEGKTFTSLNLAISIAMELDRTVLLVDADLAKPGLSRILNINNRPGLTDRLINEDIDLKDLLLRTDVPKLTVLPAGRRHRRSTELLASNNMRALLDELALRYPDRVVLFDSPPLLATSEAGVLAQQMGQICLVVESTVTPQFLVKDALRQLVSTDNVSLVLNKCKPDLFLGGYGYGYNYRYGYGYGYGYGQGSDD